LTASEIRHVVDAVRSHLVKSASAKAPKPITKALFNSISLREPSKYAVLQWAGTFSRKELSSAGAQVDAPLHRQADVSDDLFGAACWCCVLP
jgi:primary-amine oxidase